MTDEEYIKNISSISTEELFNSLEYYGYDSYYAELWEATIEELKKRIEQREWIPVKWHFITDEERTREGYPEEWKYILDCKMPENGEAILVQTHRGYIREDEAVYDDGWGLDSGYDWIEDIIAWMPFPEPYKEEEE